MKYQIPGTSFQVEVYTYQPEGESAKTVLTVRDLSLPKPEFNAITYNADLDFDVIHKEWIDADTTPTP